MNLNLTEIEKKALLQILVQQEYGKQHFESFYPEFEIFMFAELKFGLEDLLKITSEEYKKSIESLFEKGIIKRKSV